MSPLDAVVSKPGVSIFIVVLSASFRCKVKEPSRGSKEGSGVDGGNVEKVNRGGLILPSLTLDFPHPKYPSQVLCHTTPTRQQTQHLT